MSNERVSNALMHATISRFEAERHEAVATIELYLNAAVGIGDHPNIVGELHTAVKSLADAEEALETIRRNFVAPPSLTAEENDD
jgi:GTP cyclohydrolase III